MPLEGRPVEDLPGFWLLARLGKRVLRPGGAELTRTLLNDAGVTGADVIELAPGLGWTAAQIIGRQPRSYMGVERDPAAAASVRSIVTGHGDTITADASDTGLPADSADVVIGEAMLTMQSHKGKAAIIAEVTRLLRANGRYCVHELGLVPDDLADEVKTNLRQGLARTIKVNARPLTIAEWKKLFEDHHMVVENVQTAPMALLQPRRLIADEGLLGALRFAKNLLTHPDARRRVLAMRRTFRANRQHLVAVAMTVRPARSF